MVIKSINKELCSGCGYCIDGCPMDVFRMEEGFPIIKYPLDCMVCFACELECPEHAIYVGPERAKPVPMPW